MRHTIILMFAALSLLVLSGCAIFTTKGAAAKAEEQGRARITNVETRLNNNAHDKIDTIASLAYGTDYALSKINEPPREVQVARDINQRVVSLAGSPTVEKMKEMQETIDNLTSALASERESGQIQMELKDQEITTLQLESKALVVAKDAEIHKYMNAAQAAAASADAYKVELDKMNSWLGLGAIWYGIKKFFVSSLWIFGIGGILFVILRIVSYSNPVAASIFSIFSTIGGWFVRAIEMVIPKAVAMAGHTANKVFDVYKSTLTKLVDNIQLVKERAKAAGTEPTINEMLDSAAKDMNEDEKKIVEEIKKALQWKQ